MSLVDPNELRNVIGKNVDEKVCLRTFKKAYGYYRITLIKDWVELYEYEKDDLVFITVSERGILIAPHLEEVRKLLERPDAPYTEKTISISKGGTKSYFVIPPSKYVDIVGEFDEQEAFLLSNSISEILPKTPSIIKFLNELI